MHTRTCIQLHTHTHTHTYAHIHIRTHGSCSGSKSSSKPVRVAALHLAAATVEGLHPRDRAVPEVQAEAFSLFQKSAKVRDEKVFVCVCACACA